MLRLCSHLPVLCESWATCSLEKLQVHQSHYVHGDLSELLQGFQPRTCEDDEVHWRADLIVYHWLIGDQ